MTIDENGVDDPILRRFTRTMPQVGTRRDVERNRALLLAAGAIVFARLGLDATLDDVAAEAGLGSGTAFRHFGSRNGLIEAVFQVVAEELIGEAVRFGLDDPAVGLAGFVRTLTQRMADDRGLSQVLVGTGVECLTEDQWRRLLDAIGVLVRRAQEAGAVDPAITTADVVVFFAGIGPAVDLGAAAGVALWERQCDLFLRSIAADEAHPPTRLAPTVGAAALVGVLSGDRVA